MRYPLEQIHCRETIRFDAFSACALPAAWICGVTGSGGSRWSVEPDADAPSKPNVLKQSGIGDFPWCALRNASMTDGTWRSASKRCRGVATRPAAFGAAQSKPTVK